MRTASTRRCSAHRVGDILHREHAIGTTTQTVFRAECSCGWSTPWWASVITLLSDVHAHRYPRRGARRLGA